MAFTYFFRDMQTLDMIRDHIIPSLRARRYINIWDAGCAMGPEPYSIAMILRENMGKMIFRNVKIYSTDIDGSNLFGEIIKNGLYPKNQVARIPKDIFTKYFEPTDKPDHFRVVTEIRKCITFQKHDLLTLRPVRKNFDLIICKNVLLHFQLEQRIKVIKMFHDSLVDGGFFVMEQTQKLPGQVQTMFDPIVSNAQVFQKLE
ncbi:MAG: hypothetical protein JW786_10215 [Desulfobacterales bacterium]|nr:hypothetical protein [Desulfobacterales bacterium]